MIPSVKEIMESERIGPWSASGIRVQMKHALRVFGEQTFVLRPDQISDLLYPLPAGEKSYKTTYSHRQTVRRAVRMLQADYLESPKICEVSI